MSTAINVELRPPTGMRGADARVRPVMAGIYKVTCSQRIERVEPAELVGLL